MTIQVIDRRSSQNFVAQVSNLKSAKEVSMVKAQVIIAKQSNPQQEVKVMKQEPNYKQMYQEVLAQVVSLKQQIGAMAIRLEPKEVTMGKRIMQGGLPPAKHQEVPKQVIRIAAQSQPVQEVKVHADMHEAGRKAYLTRLSKQLRQDALIVYRTRRSVSVNLDPSTPMAKAGSLRFQEVKGGSAFFTVSTTKAGKPVSYSISYQLKRS